ncbi:phosphate ABC transporter substrate-binding protein PstS [Corynebacterium uterequi]|uniref:phosphate ABC transporter substrate-binding protein PstS n=1 Tax=Corynebacterium uterequi TaxID=1072256 RepID=UPI000640CBE5|nr:phosphate ABC transporter substrate-binding protein PstS [Corynebacterium uterequi]
MIRNFKRTASLVGVVAVGSAALVACGSGSGSELVGEGASSQQNAMAIFGAKYSEETGNTLAYNPTGSGSGRTNFVAGQVDFAGSDSPLKDDQVDPAAERCGGNEAWHLPFVIGPVAIAYNLDGVDSVTLSIPTLAQIFSGKITNWNDPAIAKDNEGAKLPDQKISVLYRSDESGTSDNFQKFLSTAAPGEWKGEGQQFPQEVGSGANGSNGVATEANSIPGAITYVEYGFVKQNDKLKAANLDFGAGSTELSVETVNAALEALEFKTEGHNMVVDADALFAQNQAGSYPLILTTYEIVCSAGYDDETAALVKEFLQTSLNNQGEIAEAGFIPVEGGHKERLQAAIDALPGGAA